MKQNEARPHKKNGTLNPDESSTNVIQEHLQDKNHIITDEDIRSIPVEKSPDDLNEEEEINEKNNSLIEVDPDEDNKQGLDSPWNIFS